MYCKVKDFSFFVVKCKVSHTEVSHTERLYLGVIVVGLLNVVAIEMNKAVNVRRDDTNPRNSFLFNVNIFQTEK